MAEAFRGQAVTGTGTTFITSELGPFNLDLLSFTFTASATAALHVPEVSIFDATVGNTVATFVASSVTGPSCVVSYTFGVGLIPTGIAAGNGASVTEVWPQALLAPQTKIILTAVDAVGATISGDVFSAVYLYGDLIDTVSGSSPAPLVPGLLPVAVAG